MEATAQRPGEARLAQAARQQRLLADVSRALLECLGPDEAEPLRRLATLVAEATSDWCGVYLVDAEGLLRRSVAWHPDPQQRELGDRFWTAKGPERWDAGPAELNVLVSRRPLVVESVGEELLRKGTHSEAAYQALRQLGLVSLLVVPLLDGDAPIGTLSLASTSHRYGPEDVDFATALAAPAALAVRNARLVRELRTERDNLHALQRQGDRRVRELLAVLSSDPNGVALFDAEGKLQFASPRLEELFGVPLAELLGQPYGTVYSRKYEQVVAPDARDLLGSIEQIFADRSLRATQLLELDRPVHRFLERTTVPVNTEGGEYLGRLFVYVDVTAARELDQQRADFLTVAAHELRTPLTPLAMYLQAMERRLQAGTRVAPDLVQRARRQVNRLAALVDDLLDVSRLESGRLAAVPEIVDLRDLIDPVVADFRAATPTHDLQWQRPRDDFPVRADPDHIEQVLVNLVQNAIKYSPTGGVVRVELARDGEFARVSVTDQGIGIPPDQQRQVFSRFFRARNADPRNFGGLGIGLFVSHAIVEQHGGRFDLTSEPGKGSTFRFWLPLVEAGK